MQKAQISRQHRQHSSQCQFLTGAVRYHAVPKPQTLNVEVLNVVNAVFAAGRDRRSRRVAVTLWIGEMMLRAPSSVLAPSRKARSP